MYVPTVLVTMIGLTAALHRANDLVGRLTIVGPSAIALTTLQLAIASNVQSSINISSLNGVGVPTHLLIASYAFLLLPVLQTSILLFMYGGNKRKFKGSIWRSKAIVRLSIALLVVLYTISCILIILLPAIKPAALQPSVKDHVSTTSSPYAAQSVHALSDRSTRDRRWSWASPTVT